MCCQVPHQDTGITHRLQPKVDVFACAFTFCALPSFAKLVLASKICQRSPHRGQRHCSCQNQRDFRTDREASAVCQGEAGALFRPVAVFFPNSVAEDHPIYYAGPAKSAPERSQLWLPVRLIPHLDG